MCIMQDICLPCQYSSVYVAVNYFTIHAFPLGKALMEAVALYDFDATDEEDLTLRVGQVIKDVTYVYEGWAMGRLLSGEVGLFPSNYVEMRKAKPEECPPPPVTEEGPLLCLLCTHTHAHCTHPHYS